VSVVGVVLAAGAGTRFGGAGPKALAVFRGRPMIAWPLAALVDGGVDRVVVVVGFAADAVAAGLDVVAGVEVARCEAWAEGLSASLRTGVAAALAGPGGAEAVVVVLADQPLLSAGAVARVVAARAPEAADAVRAGYGAGVIGHPTLLEASTFAAIGELRGDAGARELLRALGPRARVTDCAGLGRPDDADTPDALARLDGLL
jgi:molybdenum cofactor cytidylyltransferase